MQDKMASRNPVVNAIYSASFYLWFPLFRKLARWLPIPVLYALARQTVGRFFALRPKYSAAIRSNYARILGLPADAPEVAAAAREMVNQHSYHWIDFFYVAERGRAAAGRLVSGIDGYEKILRAEKAGRGVLLGTAHVGNWYIGGLLLADRGHPIHVVYKPDRFPIVERYRADLHRRWGVVEIPVGRTYLSGIRVARALAEGQIVAMQCDRDFDNTGVAAELFGAPAYFPRGPFTVAMATGAAFLPSFIARGEDGRYRVVIEDPLEIAGTGDHEADLRVNAARFVKILEERIRRSPTQWYCFYPFWDDPSRRRSGDPTRPARLR
jgi:lauroyl/myristoyl acyltransferase